MSKMKFSFVCVGIGFFISVISGLFSGVVFLTLFIRAIIFGLILGLFVYLAFSLLEKYIPELLGSSITSSEIGDPEVGQNVNITLDDESASSGEIGQTGFSERVVEKDALDELPNLSEFEGVGSSLEGDSPVDFVEEGTAGMIKNKETDIESVDVNTLAKAIHTVLERES